MAEKVSAEEAAKLGLSVKQKVSPEEAAKIGLPAKRPVEIQPASAPADESFIDKAIRHFTFDYPSELGGERTPADVLRAGASGLTYGWADELAAGVEAPFRAMGDGTSIGDAYDRTLKELQPAYQRANDKAFPATVAAGFLTGGGEKEIAKAGLQKIGPNIARGFGYGALGGAGFAKPGERVEGALEGGILNAGISGIVHKIGDTMSPRGLVYEWLKTRAEEQAAKAVGLRGGISNAAQKLGIKDAAGVQQLGREALDQGFIPFGGSKDAILKRAETKKQQVGPAIDSYFEQGDKLAPPGSANAMNYDDALVAGQDVLDELDDVAIKQTGKAEDLLDSWATTRDRGGGFLDTRKMNTSANKLTPQDKSKEIPLREEIFQDVKKAMRGNALKQLEGVLPEGELEGLRAVNKVYSTAKKIEKLSSNAATRETANRSQGLIGTLQGNQVQDAVGGGPVGGVAGFLWPRIESIATKRLPAADAVASDAARKAMANFAPILQEAQARGPMALAVTNYLLSQRHPEYRALSSQEDQD